MKDDLRKDETQGHALLNFDYDAGRDVLTIEGTVYSGAIFRALGSVGPRGVLEIVSRKDGILTVTRHEALEKWLAAVRQEARGADSVALDSEGA